MRARAGGCSLAAPSLSDARQTKRAERMHHAQLPAARVRPQTHYRPTSPAPATHPRTVSQAHHDGQQQQLQWGSQAEPSYTNATGIYKGASRCDGSSWRARAALAVAALRSRAAAQRPHP